jgi:hypothetical protein
MDPLGPECIYNILLNVHGQHFSWRDTFDILILVSRKKRTPPIHQAKLHQINLSQCVSLPSPSPSSRLSSSLSPRLHKVYPDWTCSPGTASVSASLLPPSSLPSTYWELMS